MSKCNICDNITEGSNRYQKRLEAFRNEIDDQEIVICDSCMKKKHKQIAKQQEKDNWNKLIQMAKDGEFDKEEE